MTSRSTGPRTHRSPPRSAAFTLVELLAVIAIIAILAAILFPTLGSATEKGRQSRCASNLKTWGQGFSIYLGSSEGVFPDEGIEAAVVDPTKAAAWYNQIPGYMGAETLAQMVTATPRRPPRPPSDKSIFTCPSYKVADVPTAIAASMPVFSYAYNLWIDHAVGQRESQNNPPFNGSGKSGFGQLIRLSQITKPSKFVVLGESSGISYDNMTGYHLVYRHIGTNGVNMLFGDGHVELMARTNVFVVNSASNKGRNNGVIWNPEGTPNQYDPSW